MKKARKQICKPIGPKRSDKPRGNYNIWFNKYSGERQDTGQSKTRASTRCNVEKDSGETRGSHREFSYICLKFARGCCPNGFECSWLHVVPTPVFNLNLETAKDCFGRDRHGDVRDDQSGTGSFGADDETQRTLYVGGICEGKGSHSCLYSHFKEWGEIENVRVLSSKGVAFIRYKYRANTEFAKEAMQNQSLDKNEILNIRWATSDPNPWVVKRKHIEYQKRTVDTIISANKELGLSSEPTKKRVCNSTDNLMFNEGTGFYPNTDAEYESSKILHTDQNLVDFKQRLNSDSKQPKTLADLVAWSQKQVIDNKTLDSGSTNVPVSIPKEQLNPQLVPDYGWASDSTDESD